MSKVSVTVRLPAELVQSLDDRCRGRGDRTRIIEDALRDALRRVGVGSASGRPKAVVEKPSSVVRRGAGIVSRSADGLREGDADLLDCLGGRTMTERDLAVSLDWPPMRVARVIARLGALGRVRFSGGGVEAVQ